MTNDKAIHKTVKDLCLSTEMWLRTVNEYGNQNASTDRQLEQIIEQAKNLTILYEANKPE